MKLLTRSIEDYLKAIYALGRSGGPVPTGALAEALAVAPASVSGMVRRLAETDLIDHVPYRGVQLTDAGRLAALRVIRRHRIIETYLVTALGCDWDSVHDEAERLEHAASDRLIERMAQSLDDPRFDPHGAPIPTMNGEVEEQALVPLTAIGIGTEGEFRLVSDDDPERLRYIASLGFQVGTRFELLDALPFNGPLTVLRHAPEAAPQVIGYELAQSLLCLRHELEATS
jgi:DtxR family Mn-dependent transcriptional regulator